MVGSEMDFTDSEALRRLESMDDATLDELPFGVVGLKRDGVVDRYNAHESRLAGLTRESAVGHHFFAEVAPCMNNFLVAQKLVDEPRLDETIPYVLTVRMRPTKVQIRMLKADDFERMYLLIEREG